MVRGKDIPIRAGCQCHRVLVSIPSALFLALVNAVSSLSRVVKQQKQPRPRFVCVVSSGAAAAAAASSPDPTIHGHVSKVSAGRLS